MKLSPTQQVALCIVAGRGDEPTYSSNTNGPSYIHAGSAASLEDKGLVEARYAEKDRLMTTPKWFVTDAGWDEVVTIATEDPGVCVHDAHLGLNTYDCARCLARRALRARGGTRT